MFPGNASQTACYQEVIKANTIAAAANWDEWVKPQKLTMFLFVMVAPGGGGGTGVIGANSAAAGGGGGGSGSLSTVLIPAVALPPVLYASIPFGTTAGGGSARLALEPSTIANTTLLIAGGGGAGGNASAGTGGAAGTAGAVGTTTNACLVGQGIWNFLAGQAGIIGGAGVSAGALTLPTTGLFVTGGTGGGGLPAAASTGSSGGNFTVPASVFSKFPAHLGGVGSATATNPAANGTDGYGGFFGLNYFYGGTGGASTHGTATGAGLAQSSGGNGAIGCGGGGMGGALTGSTAGVQSKGGDGRLWIYGW